ncbi:RES family NAD+ phosphorylase [Falsirhodobacter algicola]|uniref:RES domain-containing protein n=1 Tax=Falsirhodobacter algicola TaxID=2692330 RepID=A0A8J8MVF3_9RHOB|nr:RES family NAD+ phosphorylase [Falsirhodobacter algicola]QUS37430.1 RES domain-containing protein [Falsirhodobacter algicola]
MISKSTDLFSVVEGVFYRAVDPTYLGSSLSGSRRPGRYSNADQPTLYLSSSPEGVEAAMKAHAHERVEHLQLIQVSVRARHVFDLRDERLCTLAGVSLNDATAPWQDLVAEGKRPSSWDVRDRLISLGAKGLIDPSRKAPSLWHLVLFEWNKDGAPKVQQIE